jgi:hypothetical protein
MSRGAVPNGSTRRTARLSSRRPNSTFGEHSQQAFTARSSGLRLHREQPVHVARNSMKNVSAAWSAMKSPTNAEGGRFTLLVEQGLTPDQAESPKGDTNHAVFAQSPVAEPPQHVPERPTVRIPVRTCCRPKNDFRGALSGFVPAGDQPEKQIRETVFTELSAVPQTFTNELSPSPPYSQFKVNPPGQEQVVGPDGDAIRERYGGTLGGRLAKACR